MGYVAIYETGGDGQQREVCRLTFDGSAIKPSEDNATARFILGRYIFGPGGRLTADDGEAFLRALAANYSGSRLRAGQYAETTEQPPQ
jgi:hypothetical protein